MLGLPLLLGYVGQIVTPYASYRSLEGPLFGTRVGIYYSDLMSLGWTELGSSAMQSSYKLILYETPVGAADFSAESEEDLLVTVPSAVHKAVRRVLGLQRRAPGSLEGGETLSSSTGGGAPILKEANSYGFPLETIPETNSFRKSDWERIQTLSLRTRMRKNMILIHWDGSPQHNSFVTSRSLTTTVDILVMRTLLG